MISHKSIVKAHIYRQLPLAHLYNLGSPSLGCEVGQPPQASLWILEGSCPNRRPRDSFIVTFPAPPICHLKGITHRNDHHVTGCSPGMYSTFTNWPGHCWDPQIQEISLPVQSHLSSYFPGRSHQEYSNSLPRALGYFLPMFYFSFFK